jgi:hypothetical protein
MRAIADKLMALHSPQGDDIVATRAEPGSDNDEAAVKYSQRGFKKQQSHKAATRDDSTNRGGRSTNLCYYHAKVWGQSSQVPATSYLARKLGDWGATAAAAHLGRSSSSQMHCLEAIFWSTPAPLSLSSRISQASGNVDQLCRQWTIAAYHATVSPRR